MKWEYPLWRVTEGIELKTNQIEIDGKVVQTYPTNDGDMWYYDPDTGKKAQKPARDGMTAQEVKAMWTFHHAQKLKVKLQEERHDGS